MITFTDFYDLPANDYYWLLPEKFLGNKVFITLFSIFIDSFFEDSWLCWKFGRRETVQVYLSLVDWFKVCTG